MTPSRFIKAMHPKSEIAPTRDAVKKILAAGWWGQTKIHGHRAQIHIPADVDGVVVYNRQGQPHRKVLPLDVASEVHRIFRPTEGWSVIDAEWLKADDRLFVFDFLKRQDIVLDGLTYGERYALLPRVYSSPKILTLPPLKTLDQCMTVLEDPERPAYVEGLIFKAPKTRGFLDSAIVRCRIDPHG